MSRGLLRRELREALPSPRLSVTSIPSPQRGSGFPNQLGAVLAELLPRGRNPGGRRDQYAVSELRTAGLGGENI